MRTSEEIYKYYTGETLDDKQLTKKAMKEYATEVLKEAVNKVKLKTKRILWDDPKEGDDAYMNIEVIDKDSILNIINELK